MANPCWYRYVSNGENTYILQELEIKSKWGETWYALERLTDWTRIQELLALEDPPRHFRVGPLRTDELPDFDACPPRTSQPKKLKNGRWVAGGGTEAATTRSHYIYGHAKVI